MAKPNTSCMTNDLSRYFRAISSVCRKSIAYCEIVSQLRFSMETPRLLQISVSVLCRCHSGPVTITCRKSFSLRSTIQLKENKMELFFSRATHAFAHSWKPTFHISIIENNTWSSHSNNGWKRKYFSLHTTTCVCRLQCSCFTSNYFPFCPPEFQSFYHSTIASTDIQNQNRIEFWKNEHWAYRGTVSAYSLILWLTSRYINCTKSTHPLYFTATTLPSRRKFCSWLLTLFKLSSFRFKFAIYIFRFDLNIHLLG